MGAYFLLMHSGTLFLGNKMWKRGLNTIKLIRFVRVKMFYWVAHIEEIK